MPGLFPVRIVSLEPANLRSADCHHIGRGADGIDYAVKRVADHPRIPASEFICGCLAQRCSIATPPFEIGELPDGEKVFASRWEDGALSPERTEELLDGNAPNDGLKERLSSIYAFDIFVHNVDRHFRNYLFRHRRGEESILTLLAPDYSRALLYQSCPPPDLPLPLNCNTMTHFKIWRRTIGFLPEYANRTLDLLKEISSNDFGRIIGQLPDEWMSAEDRHLLLAWWNNISETRIREIREIIHGQI